MPSDKQKQLSNQIRRYRRMRNLRLREVSALVGLTSPSHVSHWEKGRKLPKLKNALKLSAIIQCPVEILFNALFNDIRHDVFIKKQSANNKLTRQPYDTLEIVGFSKGA